MAPLKFAGAGGSKRPLARFVCLETDKGSTGMIEAGRDAVRAIGERHGFAEDAAAAMAEALVRGGGRQAQFGHPALGGMGQWSAGGMLMIGDMFNDTLKARVAALAGELAAAIGEGRIGGAEPRTSETAAGGWWPDGLGTPSSTGSQNGRRYAVFPEARRLAVETEGRVRLYDTADHRIGGASQAQGGGAALAFSSQHGSLSLDTLAEVGGAPAASEPAGGPRASDEQDVVGTIRRLAELKTQGHLTDEEFAAKKSELLARL